jgi:hypothetical protein
MMDKIKGFIKQPLIAAVLGFILGLIIGLPVLGWGPLQVKWVDASPEFLRADYKEDYLRMVVESYARDKDQMLALTRWQALGEGANDVLLKVQMDPRLSAEAIAQFSNLVQAPMPLPTLQTGGTEGNTEATPGAILPFIPTTTAAKPSAGLLGPAVAIFCILTLIIAGTLVYLLLIRKRTGGTNVFGARHQAEEVSKAAERTNFDAEGSDTPVAQFMTTYMLGDDLYDDSFSIDAPTGEFLGECGVGVSETVGVGDPKKVTAFEVWLFDKNDIQTVTKLVMSEHAFSDPGISQRLASKGEPILVQPGQKIMLETATLQLEARVVDMSYGQAALPANSFFDRLTLELAIWPRVK